ncbi:unnamed protein product [Vitrella brassicaformis CCMP3155]|uniref:Uncharacterized protein n=1 Tax=Vitrella brassicaformis (strain CCMP3155) TaxID=1169540 RepID=A0A0G4FYJ8_VITBC|nr:unnamed protein product [Vitrella brassicaformis CCMP3155]|eukprot:CEM20112.1 unnamed protein product [Vitrella brassicaformis CCMP3155]
MLPEMERRAATLRHLDRFAKEMSLFDDDPDPMQMRVPDVGMALELDSLKRLVEQAYFILFEEEPSSSSAAAAAAAAAPALALLAVGVLPTSTPSSPSKEESVPNLRSLLGDYGESRGSASSRLEDFVSIFSSLQRDMDSSPLQRPSGHDRPRRDSFLKDENAINQLKREEKAIRNPICIRSVARPSTPSVRLLYRMGQENTCRRLFKSVKNSRALGAVQQISKERVKHTAVAKEVPRGSKREPDEQPPASSKRPRGCCRRRAKCERQTPEGERRVVA